MVIALRFHVVAFALVQLLSSCEGRTARQQEHSSIAQAPVTIAEGSSGVQLRPKAALSLLLQALSPLSSFIQCLPGVHLSARRQLLAALDPLLNSPRSMNRCSSLMMATDNPEVTAENRSSIKAWPCGDSLDKDLFRQTGTIWCNSLLLPLTGAIDLIFVGKLGSTLAIAGQAAADRVFNTAGLLNVASSVAQPRVGTASSTGDQDSVQREVGAGIFLSVLIGSVISLGTGLGARYWLLAVGNEAALPFSLPYFMFRLPGQIPQAFATVGFAALVATKDTVTALKISALGCIVNAVFNYVFMYPAGLGIAGAALATTASQVAVSIAYLGILLRRKLLKWSKALRPPAPDIIPDLVKAVGSLQVRNIAANIALLAVTKVTQNLDTTGLAASAHAVATTFWQLGGTLLFALGIGAQTLTAGELGKSDSTPGAARATARRALSWGALVGTAVCAFQLLGLPLLHVFTDVLAVQEAARLPLIVAACLQPFNGVTFVGEALMGAAGEFGRSAKGMVISVFAFLLALRVAPPTLVGVWCSFWVWMLIRFANVVYFFWFSESSLKPAGESTAASISKDKTS